MLNPLDFLICGSAASEGIPGPFCSCPVCSQARQRGGRELRTRAGYQLGERIRFDFGADAPLQARLFELDYTKIRHLFFTHSHSDHLLAVDDFATRQQDISALTETLHIYGNRAVFEKIDAAIEQRWAESRMEFHEAVCGEDVRLDAIRVTPLAANHIPTEQALLYLVETPGSRLLLATDSSTFPDATFDFLAGKRIDHLLIDCTWGMLDREWGHLGIPNIRRIAERLRASGAIMPETRIYPTHFSHYCAMTQQELEQLPDLFPAYDGMRIPL